MVKIVSMKQVEVFMVVDQHLEVILVGKRPLQSSLK